MLHKFAIGLFILICSLTGAFAEARNCGKKEFAAMVDETAKALRNLNSDSEKRFQEKLQRLAREQGWSEEQKNRRASTVMNDGRLESFNQEIELLVGQIDGLSNVDAAKVSCDRLNALKNARDRLLSVMGQKSGYMLAALEGGGEGNRSAALTPSTASDGTLAPKPAEGGASKKSAKLAEAKPEPAPQPTPPSSAAANAPAPDKSFEQRMKEALRKSEEPSGTWSANVAREERPAAGSRGSDRDYLPPRSLQPPAQQAEGAPPAEPRDVAALPEPSLPDGIKETQGGDAYTIQEIRDAGRGVFGTLSAELAGVINYAFQNFGRPNAYVIGDEGGGAFLAGLRYGSGRLYMKQGGQELPPREVYWQGPSVGWDFGATGSRTLFLVYNLTDAENIYRRFTGVDGSAYVVGGLGLTVLSAKDIVLVPIRTGLGLRIGANIGYLKFSERSTWNPF